MITYYTLRKMAQSGNCLFWYQLKSPICHHQALGIFCSLTLMVIWWLNWGPVGGVLSANSSVLSSASLPPCDSLSLCSSPSLLPPLLAAYQVHHPLTPRSALENNTTNTHAHCTQHLISEIRNSRHQSVRLLSPCYLAGTTWPAGAVRSERTERGGVGKGVGGEKESAQEQTSKCEKDAEEEETREEESQMGPERGRESFKKAEKTVSEWQQCQKRRTVVFGACCWLACHQLAWGRCNWERLVIIAVNLPQSTCARRLVISTKIQCGHSGFQRFSLPTTKRKERAAAYIYRGRVTFCEKRSASYQEIKSISDPPKQQLLPTLLLFFWCVCAVIFIAPNSRLFSVVAVFAVGSYRVKFSSLALLSNRCLQLPL